MSWFCSKIWSDYLLMWSTIVLPERIMKTNLWIRLCYRPSEIVLIPTTNPLLSGIQRVAQRKLRWSAADITTGDYTVKLVLLSEFDCCLCDIVYVGHCLVLANGRNICLMYLLLIWFIDWDYSALIVIKITPADTLLFVETNLCELSPFG